MNKDLYKTNYLLKNNIIFTALVIILNLIPYYISAGNKESFTIISLLINCLIYAGYRIIISNLWDKYRLQIKKELLYINYPLTIALIFVFIAIVLLINIIIIGVVNKDAVNSVFILSFFLSTMTMLLPSMLIIIYMFLICPSFLIPSFERKKQNSKSDILIFIFFISFIIYLLFKFVYGITDNYLSKDKYRAKKLPIEYSTKYLKYKNMLPERINILNKQEIKVPIYYTADGFKFENYIEAEDFCRSINARVPNHIEIYNIIFNRFDTFGEQYYWTSDRIGKYPLTLHFKNMSYEIMIKPKGITPVLYCVADGESHKYTIKQNYFYKAKTKKRNATQTKNKKGFEFPPKIIKEELKNAEQNVNKQNIDNTLKKEATFVNFSIKHVPQEVFDKLLKQGYYYNSTSKANPYYESSNNKLNLKIKQNAHNIRLCNFPFTEYKDISIQNQREIWRQSFCSPSFELIKATPALKTRYEKDAYCISNEGRLPNIAELGGIIKTLKMPAVNNLYWTNNTVTDYFNDGKRPVAVYYTGKDFIEIKLPDNEIKANTFCIKRSNNPSQIISNYSSRFYGESGKYYAQKICPSCKYYEMPDTVLIDSYSQ